MAGSQDLQPPFSAACAGENKANCGNSCIARPNKILSGLAYMRAWGGRWAGSKASCSCCLHQSTRPLVAVMCAALMLATGTIIPYRALVY